MNGIAHGSRRALGTLATDSPSKRRRGHKTAAMSDPIASVIADKTGLEVTGHHAIGASGWSAQAQYETSDGTKYFAKTSRRSAKEMFEGEALGLDAMYATGSLRIPKVIAWGDTDGGQGSYLVTEHLNFGGRANQAEMGRQLALMHKAPPKDGDGKFGFPVDNTIGGTPQPNPWTANWVDFFREHRLMHQVNLSGNDKLKKLAKPVAENLERLFRGIDVKPACLHGDLWSGNMAAVEGQPAAFDPAVYYGHSEAEFGMSWCAGFDKTFWDAYFAENPKQRGFNARRDLYLVYHYLNHYNLFGSNYAGESERLLRRLQKHTGSD